MYRFSNFSPVGFVGSYQRTPLFFTRMARSSCYQNAVYSAVRMPIMITEPTAKAGDTLNILESMTMVLSFSCRGLTRLMITITTMISTNVIVILSRKGKSGKPPLVHVGRNFKTVDTGMVNSVPASAARAVVFFQKNPMRKIASTPGEMKPTYSWMN